MISSCKVETANLITEVVKSSDAFTSTIGNTPERAFTVFSFAVSSIVTDLAEITFSNVLLIKVSVSISTFSEVSLNSFSTSSAIALK